MVRGDGFPNAHTWYLDDGIDFIAAEVRFWTRHDPDWMKKYNLRVRVVVEVKT